MLKSLRRLQRALVGGTACSRIRCLAAAAKACANTGIKHEAVVRFRPDVVYSSLYLPEAVLRESAFKKRCKIHDLVMQGIGMALKKRGYPSIEDLKAMKFFTPHWPPSA